jgi:hypothetical protein
MFGRARVDPSEPATDGRRNGLLLALLAGATLLAGGWWWVDAEPGPVASGPTLSGSGPRRYDAAGRAIRPDQREGQLLLVDPAPGRVRNDAGAAAGLRAVDGDLPRFTGTLLRRTAWFDDGTPRTWSLSTLPGERYLLQQICVGGGKAVVSVAGADGQGINVIADCDGEFVNTELVADHDRLLVMAERVGTSRITLAVQVVARP